MKVLVTGAAGFIGSHVCRSLVEKGDDVLALVRESTSPNRIADLVGRLRTSALDLDDSPRVNQVLESFRPEAVIHLAWYAHPADYLHSKENLRSLATTIAFAQRSFEVGCRKFVGVGSCVEYASSGTPRRESDATEPQTPYGVSKLAASSAVRAIARGFEAEVAWARVFHVHGPDEHRTRLIPMVAARLAAGEAVDLSPGDQMRDHLHVSDVAAALIRLTNPGLADTFNVSSGVGVTLKEVLTTVGDIVGRRELLRFGARPYALTEEQYLVGDSTRLQKTGWTPIWTDLRTSLADSLSTSRATSTP